MLFVAECLLGVLVCILWKKKNFYDPIQEETVMFKEVITSFVMFDSEVTLLKYFTTWLSNVYAYVTFNDNFYHYSQF